MTWRDPDEDPAARIAAGSEPLAGGPEEAERGAAGFAASAATPAAKSAGAVGAAVEGVGLYRLLVESVRDYAIFALDPHGRIMSWNAGAERFKGYRRDEIIGRYFSIFYPQAEKDAGKPAAGSAATSISSRARSRARSRSSSTSTSIASGPASSSSWVSSPTC